MNNLMVVNLGQRYEKFLKDGARRGKILFGHNLFVVPVTVSVFETTCGVT
jgi:hypothetical protein